MRALSSSLMLRWDAAAEEYEHLGAALARHGIAGVSGGDFMHTLGAMCGGEVTSGTLIGEFVAVLQRAARMLALACARAQHTPRMCAGVLTPALPRRGYQTSAPSRSRGRKRRTAGTKILDFASERCCSGFLSKMPTTAPESSRTS